MDYLSLSALAGSLGYREFTALQQAAFSDPAARDPNKNLLVIGPTTGALYITAAEMHLDSGPTQQAVKGQTVAIKVDAKIRPSDKLYRLVRNTPR